MSLGKAETLHTNPIHYQTILSQGELISHSEHHTLGTTRFENHSLLNIYLGLPGVQLASYVSELSD